MPGLAALQDAAALAAEAVRARPGRWFLACDTDADGLAAAAVTATALRRAGRRFQVRAGRGKATADHEAVLREEADGWVFLDKGTSHLARLARHVQETGRPVVVLDHHNVPDDVPAQPGLVHVNPRAVGLDGGRDASSATVAVAFALALGGERNLDLAPVGLSGAIGDWQHRGGWQGWNAELVRRGLASGHITQEPIPRLVGVHLAEAIPRRGLPGLTTAEGAAAFLRGLGIDPEAEPEDLDPAARTRLVSALVLRGLAEPAVAGADARAAGGTGEARDAGGSVAAPLVEQALWNPRLGTSLRQAFRIADACGRGGHAGTGIAYLLGDPAARAPALERFGAYKRDLHAALEELRRTGTERRAACQVAWTRDPAYTGMVGGLGVTAVLPDASLPLVVLARRGDGLVQVSTRGTVELVAQGLDLGRAVLQAARSVGEEGGGHPVAAGAVVPEGRVPPFLDALDAALQAQGWS